MSAMRGMGPRTSAARLGRSGLRWLRGDGLRLGGGARRRPSVAVAAAIAGLLVVLACGWLWFRDSSLVAVKRVQITGVSGPSASRIREALRSSALEMTTLTVDMSRLRAAVQPYPDVKTLRVSTQFPHGVTIHVFEQVPVAALSAGGRTVAVSAGGELLGRPLASDGRLPQISLSTPPQGAQLRGAGIRAALRVLAAAPWPLLAHIARAGQSASSGVVLTVRNGPQLRFGPATELAAKWAAAVAVLGSSGAAGAQYIDVSDPAHPAAGVTTTATGSSASSGTATGSAGVGGTVASGGTTAGG